MFYSTFVYQSLSIKSGFIYKIKGINIWIVYESLVLLHPLCKRNEALKVWHVAIAVGSGEVSFENKFPELFGG